MHHAARQLGIHVADAVQRHRRLARHLDEIALDQGLTEQPLLVPEVVEDTGPGHPDVLGQVGDVGGAEALRRKQLDGGVEDLLAATVTPRLLVPSVSVSLRRHLRNGRAHADAVPWKTA